MADMLLQCVVLGQILENPEVLNDIGENDFGDFELAAIVTALKDGHTEPLRQWLHRRHVTWSEGERAILAIRNKIQFHAACCRVDQVRLRARFLVAATPAEMDARLRELLRQLEPLEDATTEKRP